MTMFDWLKKLFGKVNATRADSTTILNQRPLQTIHLEKFGKYKVRFSYNLGHVVPVKLGEVIDLEKNQLLLCLPVERRGDEFKEEEYADYSDAPTIEIGSKLKIGKMLGLVIVIGYSPTRDEMCIALDQEMLRLKVLTSRRVEGKLVPFKFGGQVHGQE